MTSQLQPVSPPLFPHTALGEPSGGRVLIVTGRLPWSLVDRQATVPVVPNGVRRPAIARTVKRGSGSRWIGWTGMSDRPEYDVRRELDERFRSAGVTALHLSRTEGVGYYHRFANGVLQQALHDGGHTEWNAGDWESYRSVNARYAEAVLSELRVGDLIWVHDFHLMLVPRLVREQCPWARISFILHAPFPAVDSLARFPYLSSIVDGMLGADAIDLPAREHVQNFLAAVSATRLCRIGATVVDDAGRPVCVFASSKA